MSYMVTAAPLLRLRSLTLLIRRFLAGLAFLGLAFGGSAVAPAATSPVRPAVVWRHQATTAHERPARVVEPLPPPVTVADPGPRLRLAAGWPVISTAPESPPQRGPPRR
jgi:hypothetical protein